MTAQQTRLLITGASGFIGSHVAQHAIEVGYLVRLTARSSKVDAVRETFGKKAEVVAIDDIVSGDFSEALKGVDAVLHVAAPLPGKADAEGMLKGALNGTMNIVKQATAAGIKRIIFTGSLASHLDATKVELTYTDRVLNHDTWTEATEEQVLDGTRDPFWIYIAAKTIAERELWKFADEHPEVDITAINPAGVYGPIVKGAPIPKGDLAGYSSIGMFYEFFFPKGGNSVKATGIQQLFPLCIDVRDVAKAHILALSAPPTAKVGRKRLLLGAVPFWLRDVVPYLSVARPQYRARFPDVSGSEKPPIVTLDASRAREVLGLSEYIDWRKTAEDSADSVMQVEAGWS